MSANHEPSVPRITVVGSYLVGLTIRAPRLPVRGETLIGRDFQEGPGGKGSNQAIQAARLGARVEFAALLGEDGFAAAALELYREEGVGTRYLRQTAEHPTGVGFIILDEAGENMIILDTGANARFGPAQVDRLQEQIAQSDALLTQLEIPVQTAIHALHLARQAGVLTILNPAPAQAIALERLGLADIITPNETELRILLGRAPDDPTDSLILCRELLQAGVRAIVLTRGAKGALIVDRTGATPIAAFPVQVQDTTGAGDSFSATLTVSLAQGLSLEEAVRRACAAGALTCTRLGVIPGLPRQDELERFLSAR